MKAKLWLRPTTCWIVHITVLPLDRRNHWAHFSSASSFSLLQLKRKAQSFSLTSPSSPGKSPKFKTPLISLSAAVSSLQLYLWISSTLSFHLLILFSVQAVSSCFCCLGWPNLLLSVFVSQQDHYYTMKIEISSFPHFRLVLLFWFGTLTAFFTH